jgi:5-methylcytosine-specific restriction endonuclease McrA
MTKACKIEGCQCDTSRLRRGMCNAHYLRVMRHGDPHFRIKAGNREVCAHRCLVDGCDAQAKAEGYCGKHFARFKRTGDPLRTRRLIIENEEQRKASKARAQRRYRQTPYGKLRTRYNVSKMRTMAKAQIGIPKEDFERLWATPLCALCGDPFANDDEKSLDHKRPLARGGDNSFANLQLAHLTCNQRKSSNFVCA